MPKTSYSPSLDESNIALVTKRARGNDNTNSAKYSDDDNVSETDRRNMKLDWQIEQSMEFRGGLPYSFPKSYILKDNIPREDVCGDYDVIWTRLSISEQGSEDAPYFRYHRTQHGTVKISECIDKEDSSVKMAITVTFKDTKNVWTGTPLGKYLSSTFELKESEEESSGFKIDSIMNLTGKCNSSGSQGVSGGLGVLNRTEAGLLYRDDCSQQEANQRIYLEDIPVGITMNERYYDASSSWLCRHKNILPEVALKIRQYLYAPPVFFFKDNSVVIRMYWNTRDSKYHVYAGMACRKRS